MQRYACINEKGTIIAIGEFGETKRTNMIPVSDEFIGYGKRWDGVKWVDYIPEKMPVEPSDLEIIKELVEKSNEELRAEGSVKTRTLLLPVGATMTQALAEAGLDVPATAGTFAENWDEWIADGNIARAKSLWFYNGIGYQARTDIQKIEVYAPDLATNNYAVRPIPDAEGIYPATINMDVSIGMKVRGEDDRVYECYANPITSLQHQPKDVPSSFRLYEG